ncbi:LysR family transcriptional regulator [Herbaspirillum rubrisubalbicans]|uniref:LysR family transcriptional regulator n=2 Tax=Herbaspirillum rubrisubalbicans TaxID=80842 RepID=A0ABX9BXY9_9BURK|nr:LysR family transcriptional regulator [Herbaspirillum rubrisubalbicans]MCP1572449.1 DNA-binding transcriptional LysR family regulator [Herbaspirillum rubrisubalbicans]NQE50601.1 LysR family transcriptional regulator [Herbaspirillum rubrisubalbicans]QJQ01078.1 LysR family transcriptional regulator [Herbaspirillum rubrisubalbicans Os34]RAM62844.1 LysR family transcriptional regulator [Herbaspirillum rubrisubalbicans]RAN49268.1 LysR family transcriptional regulator [Herbaspirillum rubrisubalbi
MKIDILGVQAFVAIADQGSFQGAAGALHVTQTAVTLRLRKLEDFLGVTLIERTTRSIALTAIGQDFLPQARRLLAELAEALVEIRETGIARRGDVSIACVPTVGVQYLPRIMQAYSARYPHNRIKILDHASSAVAEAVLRREVEFGITIAREHHPELVSMALTEDRYVLICHKDHPLARRRRIAWMQLQSYPLIFAGEVSGNRALLDPALKANGFVLRSFYEVQRSSTAVGLVAQGVGVAVVPKLAMQEGAYPNVRMIELVDPVVSRTLVLITRKAAHLSPAAQALYDMIREQESNS